MKRLRARGKEASKKKEMVFPDWSDSENDDWGAEWKGENWSMEAVDSVLNVVTTPERRPTFTATGMGPRLRPNCTGCSGGQDEDEPWYVCSCQPDEAPQGAMEARRIQLFKDDWAGNVQEDTGPPPVPEFPFGLSLPLDKPAAVTKKAKKIVNKKLEKGSATVCREYATTKKTLRLIKKKLSMEEALAWKDQSAERRTLRLVNNGGALLRHFANPPEVTTTVQIHRHK